MCNVAEVIRRHVDGEYRKLVESLADGDELTPAAAVKVLSALLRTPEQLQADVLRLQSRRHDVARLKEVEELTQELEHAKEAYRAAVVAEQTARAELARAQSNKSKSDTLETRQQYNETCRRLCDASDATGFAFRAMESARRQRDSLRDELSGRLQATGIAGTDATQARNFALVS